MNKNRHSIPRRSAADLVQLSRSLADWSGRYGPHYQVQLDLAKAPRLCLTLASEPSRAPLPNRYQHGNAAQMGTGAAIQFFSGLLEEIEGHPQLEATPGLRQSLQRMAPLLNRPMNEGFTTGELHGCLLDLSAQLQAACKPPRPAATSVVPATH